MEILESTGNWMVALGITLFHSLWIGILFLSILRFTMGFLSSRFAIQRYRVASMVLIVFTATMTIIFSLVYAPVPSGSEFISTGYSLLSPDFPDFEKPGVWLRDICYLMTHLYLVGMVLYLLYTVLSLRRVHSARKTGIPVTGVWLDRFMELKERTGIGFQVLFLISDRTVTPFLTGIVKPAIIVPAGMMTQLPFSQVEGILMHELFHLKRFDHLANLFQKIIEIIFFYHPAVWALSRIIRAEREKCCDDLVIKGCSHPVEYARALYHLAVRQGRFPAPVTAATGNHRGYLKDRILRILNPRTMKTNIQEKLSTLLLLTGGFLVVALISGFSSAFSITQFNQVPREIPDPVNGSVTAVEPQPAIQPDTLPPVDPALPEKEEVDWDKIKKEMESARIEAMESVDWDEIKKEIESARIEAMESVDWDEIKKEIESARIEAMESVDWDEIKKELENVHICMDSVMKELNAELDLMMEDFKMEMKEMKEEIEN